MRCDECRYFFAIPPTVAEEQPQGACRINPPVLLNTAQSGFPTVRADWWCGKYEPKPTDYVPPVKDTATTAAPPMTPLTSFNRFWPSRA